MKDPVLAAMTLRPSDGYKVARTFRVEGGLHFIRSNGSPHFTLTYTTHRKGFPNQCCSGGAGHREILKHFPRFADLAALHLSDIDGVPMHAEANGWYWLAGALGGMGEQFHGGNAKVQHWKDDGSFNGYRESTPAECLKTFADHCRLPLSEASARADQVRLAANPRAEWKHLMEAMRPRWKAEAEACIAKHNLRVFGDAWPVKVEG